MNKKNNINPQHYKQGNIEVIDFILDQKMNYLEGNITKYIARYKYKNGLEDLKKAQWYLDKLISQLENKDIDET
tara:strand:- start:1649 stop:1870 length:222 start_codon:yes stop_codon:yes gene_type:complete